MSGGFIFNDNYGRRNRDLIMPRILVLGKQSQLRTLLSERFSGDICPRCSMTYWMCDECGFTIVATTAPDFCPECSAPCNFTNITCYIPELGTPDIIDMQLYHS